MKRRIWIGLLVCLAMVLGLFSCALAATDPLKVSMELSQSKFTGTKEITVSINVSNVGEGDMPGAVTLYYPNGNQVDDFGSPTLLVGEAKSWTGTWKVTQKQLEAGKITFKIKYSVYNDSGELTSKTKNFSKAITYTGEVAQVEVNRTIVPQIAQKGQEVLVTYDVVNSGNVDITAVTIKENKNVSSKSGVIDTVKAGEKGSYTFTVTMGTKDLTSQATITYKSGGKSYSTKVAAATISYGVVDLSASLASDKKGGSPGDVVTLTLTLKNTGNVDYTNITVTDAVLGEVFTNLTLAAGKSDTFTKEVPITDSADYMFVVTAADATGLTTSATTGKVSVTAVSAAQKVSLTLNATSDRSVVYTLPGTVKFTVAVTNESESEVTDVTIYASGVKLYSFPSILAGETRTFTRDVSVSMQGQYQFTAQCKNQLQEQVQFLSNIVPVTFEQPTAVPTQAPIVTPPQPVYVDVPTDDDLPEYVESVQSTLNVVTVVCAVLAILCILLMGAALVLRTIKKKQSDAAYDHLERGTYRDYSVAAPKEKGRRKALPEEAEEPEETYVAEDAQSSEDAQGDDLADYQEDEMGLPATGDESGDMMAATLRKLSILPEDEQAEPEDAAEDTQAEEADETQPEEEESEPETAEDAAPTGRRHRRSQRYQGEE